MQACVTIVHLWQLGNLLDYLFEKLYGRAGEECGIEGGGRNRAGLF